MNLKELCRKLGLDSEVCRKCTRRYGDEVFRENLEAALDNAYNMAFGYGSEPRILGTCIVPATKQNLNGGGDCDALISIRMCIDESTQKSYLHPIQNDKGYKG